MKTLKKRILSCAMAGVLAMSLAVPAFAAGGDADADPAPTNTKTTITGAYEEADIDVVVPTAGNVVINPYGLGVTVTTSEGVKVNIAGQIMTAPLAIKNKTDLNLSVGATVVAVLPEDATMKLNTSSTKGTPDLAEDAEGYVAPATGKNAFVKLDVVAAPNAVSGDEDDTLADNIIKEYAKEANWAKANSVVVGTKAATGENLATLKKANVDTTDGSFTSYAAGSIALFRLSGDCVTAPKTPWAETDTFTVNVAFSFTPAAATTPAP